MPEGAEPQCTRASVSRCAATSGLEFIRWCSQRGYMLQFNGKLGEGRWNWVNTQYGRF